jgi:hypothetical protein
MNNTLNGFVDLTDNEFDLTDEERESAIFLIAELNTNGADMKTLKQCYYADQLDWASGLSDEELREELTNHSEEE